MDAKVQRINSEEARPNSMRTVVVDPRELPPAYDVVVGRNMVDFKSTTTNATAQDYLDGTEYVRIYWFKNGPWFSVPQPYEHPNMEPGLGYWVAFTEPEPIYP